MIIFFVKHDPRDITGNATHSFISQPNHPSIHCLERGGNQNTQMVGELLDIKNMPYSKGQRQGSQQRKNTNLKIIFLKKGKCLFFPISNLKFTHNSFSPCKFAMIGFKLRIFGIYKGAKKESLLRLVVKM